MRPPTTAVPRRRLHHRGLTGVVVVLLCGGLLLPSSARAVGDASRLTFAEDASVDQLARRLRRRREGRVLWVYLNRDLVRGPIFRSPSAVFVTGQRTIYQIGAQGRLQRSHSIGGVIAGGPILSPRGGLLLVSRLTHGRLVHLGPKLQPRHDYPLRYPSYVRPGWADDHTVFVSLRRGLTAWRLGHGQRWLLSLRYPSLGPPAIGADGSIYACSATRQLLYRATPSGRLVWKKPAGQCRTKPLLTPQGLVVVTSDAQVLAYRPDGTRAWRFAFAGSAAEPAVGHDGSIYFVSSRGSLISLNASGRLRWSFPLAPKTRSRPTIGPGGRVHVTSASGHLLVITPQGRLRWYARVPRPGTQVAVRYDGAVYVLAEKDSLRLIAPPSSRR